MLLRLSMALVSLVALDADPVDPTPAFIAGMTDRNPQRGHCRIPPRFEIITINNSE
jgi:hypothetical protein